MYSSPTHEEQTTNPTTTDMLRGRLRSAQSMLRSFAPAPAENVARATPVNTASALAVDTSRLLPQYTWCQCLPSNRSNCSTLYRVALFFCIFLVYSFFFYFFLFYIFLVFSDFFFKKKNPKMSFYLFIFTCYLLLVTCYLVSFIFTFFKNLFYSFSSKRQLKKKIFLIFHYFCNLCNFSLFFHFF